MEKLHILHRYSEHQALISLGHSYTIPSRITKREMIELLDEFGDDEVLNLAQGEFSGRPILIRPANYRQENPEWIAYMRDEVKA